MPSLATVRRQHHRSRRTSCLVLFPAGSSTGLQFNALVNGPDPRSGFMDVLEGRTASRQRYIPNTAILETIFGNHTGSAVRILDWAPRFKAYGRIYRPPMIVRRIEPHGARGRITTGWRPTFDYGATPPTITIGSSHLRYVSGSSAVRLTSDAPVSYVRDEVPFLLDRPVTMIIGSDERLNDRVDRVSREFLDDTVDLLARVGALSRRAVRVAGRGDPRRDHAEAVQLRGHRRDRRGAHHLDSRSAGQRAQLGLPLLLAARRLSSSCTRSTGWARRGPWRTTSRYIIDISPLEPAARRCSRSIGIVPESPLDETMRRRARGLSRHGPGAHRQAGRTASARTTSTAASCWRPRRCSSTSACRGAATSISIAGSSSWASRPPTRSRSARMPASGNFAAAARAHLFGRRCAGRRCDRLGHDRRAASALAERAPALARIAADALQANILERAWNAERGMLRRQPRRRASSMPSLLLLPSSASSAADDPRFLARSTRSRSGCCATAS